MFTWSCLTAGIPRNEMENFAKAANVTLTNNKQVRRHQYLDDIFERDPDKLRMFLDICYRNRLLSPTVVEHYLGCTLRERKRWTQEGKLTVDGTETIFKWKKLLTVPLFSWQQLSSITPDMVTSWRNEHKKKVDNIIHNRDNNAKQAAVTRKKNKEQRLNAMKAYENIVNSFKTEEQQLIYKLCFWTALASRWAKYNQVKIGTAKGRKVDYQNNLVTLYALKDSVLQLLYPNKYLTVKFYKPDNPHKVYLCEEHYKEACMCDMHPYVFAALYKEQITACPLCGFEENWYSLYYFTVNLQDYSFKFHMPYPIGKYYLPNPDTLETVKHEEQDGLFRFGRPVTEDEMISYPENVVKKQLEENIDSWHNSKQKHSCNIV